MLDGGAPAEDGPPELLSDLHQDPRLDIRTIEAVVVALDGGILVDDLIRF